MDRSQTEMRVAPRIAPDLFAITVAFDLRDGDRDRFLELVRANATASLMLERECLRFDVLVPLATGRPDVVLYEVYTDRAAFDAHLATRHFVEFDAATRDMVTRKAVVEFVARGNPK